ncbi:uncharacterized protein LOC123715777 [Pieris brassicae]|uniref:uncharacterized protein LOC123715777 n=1 Tax=Pieris brassicae TaxID=7116 RepID=UPI001E65FB99|nr:uncharacterized protein LOC123715777 [Pieris brassicae]
MDPKTTVVKSKSSNGGVSNKREKQKFTKSDAEFQPFCMKKRGVYVENKDDKLINIYENNDAEIKKKPPPRPRPGQKKFLTSVLNILSKSTTGTQYPDSEQIRARKKTSKIHKKRYQEPEPYNDEYIETTIKTKKPKYKSKILNGDSYISFNDKFVVLQSKKDIIHTPSNFSENFPISESSNPIRELLENNIYSGVAEGLAKEILEGRSETPVINPDDPSTLVADTPKDDKKIYNFFVDLLETTFDVYNVETEQAKSKDSILEIEETVAKKLNFNIDTPEKEECHDHDYDLKFQIQEDKIYEPVYMNQRPKAKRKLPKRCLHSRSFVYSQPLPKSKSLDIKKKTQTQQSKKNELLNTIKEELKMDFMTYEEPQNLFQALRNMAKYKRKCQGKKTIHFEQNDRSLNDECIFSRDIFSDKKIANRKVRKEKIKVEKEAHSVAKHFRPKKEPEINLSSHSLKVFGIEYENNYDHTKYIPSSPNISEVEDFNGSFGISASSLDIKGFYSLIQE